MEKMDNNKAIEILKDFNDYRRNEGAYDVDKPCEPKFTAAEIGEAIDCAIDALIGHDKADMTILDAVVAESGLSLRAIRGHGRNRNLVVARNVAAWLMRDDGHTLTEIGKTFNRSHAAIIHMCDEVSYWLASPLVYRRELRLFERVKKRTGRK